MKVFLSITFILGAIVLVHSKPGTDEKVHRRYKRAVGLCLSFWNCDEETTPAPKPRQDLGEAALYFINKDHTTFLDFVYSAEPVIVDTLKKYSPHLERLRNITELGVYDAAIKYGSQSIKNLDKKAFYKLMNENSQKLVSFF